MASVIRSCECPNPYQDSRYGEGKRVMSETGPAKNPDKGYRCTSCGKDQSRTVKK